MKICTQCKIEKPLAEFSKQATCKDGLHCWCKACVSVYMRSPKVKETQWRYNQTPQRKEAYKRYRQEYPEKEKAHRIVNHAIRDGKLESSIFCEFCGLPAKTEGHHADYAKPLEIDWLCRKCHIKIHRRKNG